jgi:hypothetical protein
VSSLRTTPETIELPQPDDRHLVSDHLTIERVQRGRVVDPACQTELPDPARRDPQAGEYEHDPTGGLRQTTTSIEPAGSDKPRPHRCRGAIEQICPLNELVLLDEIGFALLDHTGCQLPFQLISTACDRGFIAIGSQGAFEAPGKIPPDRPTGQPRCHSSTGSVTTPTSSRPLRQLPNHPPNRRQPTNHPNTAKLRGISLATTEDTHMAVDNPATPATGIATPTDPRATNQQPAPSHTRGVSSPGTRTTHSRRPSSAPHEG